MKLDIVASLCFLLVCVASFAGAIDQIFDAPMLYHNRPNTGDIELGDFNNDGIVDIVDGQTYSEQIMFHFGNGDGTFQSAMPFMIDNFNDVNYIAVGDVNKDGLDDIVTLSPNFSSFLCIYLSDVNSSDVPNVADTPIFINTGSWMHRLELADEDFDGDLDVILGGDYAGLMIMYNNGDSTFTTQDYFGVGPSLSLLTDDLNNDNYPDFVSYYSFLTITLSDGVGGYHIPDTINFVELPLNYTMKLVDITGDGILDLCFTTGNTTDGFKMEVAVNQGNGVFSDAIEYDIIPENYTFFSVGNIFGDIYGDIIAISQDSSKFTVINHTGNFNFDAGVEYKSDRRPILFQPYDFNGDGYDDLYDGGWNALGIYLNHGDGTFPEGNPYFNYNGTQGDYRMKHIITDDFNNDTYPDLAMFAASGSSVQMTGHIFRIYYNDGVGQFGADHDEFSILPFYKYYRGIPKDYMVSGDFIGDNSTDMLVCGNGNYSIFTGPITNGSFAAVDTFTINGEPVGIAADIDGDLDQDLVMTINASLFVKYNVDGVHSFDTTFQNVAGTNISTIDTLDVDNDGDLDFIAAGYTVPNCYTIENDGGILRPLQIIPVTRPYDTSRIIDVVGADFNDDGYGDAAVLWSHPQDNETGLVSEMVSILMNDGAGNLSHTVTRHNGDYARNMNASDMDGDGDIDLVFNSYYPFGPVVLLNEGSGDFSETGVVYAALSPGGWGLSNAVADFNMDGSKDIALFQNENASTNTKATITLLFNTGEGSNPVVCGDANSDGGVNVSDAVYLINCVFRGGPCPTPETGADPNCDGITNISDAVYLINHVFRFGPGPCEWCK